MLEAEEGLFYIPWHGDVNAAFLVVKLDGVAKNFLSFFVDSDLVEVLQDCDKMVEILLTNVFDAKIVHNECKGYFAFCMRPKCQGVWSWMITVL